MMFADYDDVLTVVEMSELLKIGIGKDYELLNSGEIRARKIGSGWRIAKTSVEEYMTIKILG